MRRLRAWLTGTSPRFERSCSRVARLASGGCLCFPKHPGDVSCAASRFRFAVEWSGEWPRWIG